MWNCSTTTGSIAETLSSIRDCKYWTASSSVKSKRNLSWTWGEKYCEHMQQRRIKTCEETSDVLNNNWIKQSLLSSFFGSKWIIMFVSDGHNMCQFEVSTLSLSTLSLSGHQCSYLLPLYYRWKKYTGCAWTYLFNCFVRL